jgi:hypothetical protein
LEILQQQAVATVEDKIPLVAMAVQAAVAVDVLVVVVH